MNDLVGIIRKSDEITEALEGSTSCASAYKHIHVEGHRQYNPGWNLAIDLRNMLLVSECVAKAALERTESRGGHTRDDHPGMDADWRNTLLVCRVGYGDDQVPASSSPASRRYRCGPTCWSSSRSPSWRSTTPTTSWPTTRDGRTES